MEIATVRIDDRFRIVIPKRLRSSAGICENTCLHICAFKNVIFLRKINTGNDQITEIFGELDNLGVVENDKQ